MPVIITHARAILQNLFGRVSFTPVATMYIGLSTTNPGTSGTGITEPSGGSYARVAVTNNTTNWVLDSGGAALIDNGAQIDFPESSASWGTITHIFIADALTSGNILYYGTLSTSRAIATATTIYFPIGALDITLT